MKVNSSVENIKCFTTRPDTLFGFSFLALSADHPISKFYEENKDFPKNLKNNVLKQELQKKSIAQAEKIGFKTDLWL